MKMIDIIVIDHDALTMPVKSSSWFVYIAECSDLVRSLYTGISINVAMRIQAHNGSHRGAKYTRARRPVVLVYQEGPLTKQDAMRREREIKSMTRSQKLSLIEQSSDNESG